MSIQTLELVTSAVLTMWASALYVAKALRGDAKPRPASWAIWSVLLGIGAYTDLRSHQLPIAVYMFCCVAACALTAVLALRFPSGQRERATIVWGIQLDLICVIGAAIGLVLLFAVGLPLVAIAVTVATDLAAYLPTMSNGWKYPSDEPWTAYLLFAAGAALALAAVNLNVAVAVAYPAYLLIANTAMTCIIIGRLVTYPPSGRHVRRPHPASVALPAPAPLPSLRDDTGRPPRWLRAAEYPAGQKLNSPRLTAWTNRDHDWLLNASFGPSRSLESRTATAPGRLLATSTQAPPLLLRALLCQMAAERSV